MTRRGNVWNGNLRWAHILRAIAISNSIWKYNLASKRSFCRESSSTRRGRCRNVLRRRLQRFANHPLLPILKSGFCNSYFAAVFSQRSFFLACRPIQSVACSRLRRRGGGKSYYSAPFSLAFLFFFCFGF